MQAVLFGQDNVGPVNQPSAQRTLTQTLDWGKGKTITVYSKSMSRDPLSRTGTLTLSNEEELLIILTGIWVQIYK